MKNFCYFIALINFIYSTITNNKRKFQDEFKNCHNQDGTADFKTLSDEKLRDIIIKDLEQYKDGQNRPEHTKHFECICNYEDFCNFFNFPKSKRVKRDESDNCRKEKIDLNVKNENKDLKNEQTLSEQLKVFEKNDKLLEKALQHGSNLGPMDKKSESDCNPIQNLSFVFESSNSLECKDKDLNSSTNIIETIDFKDEFMMALKLNILKFITNNVCTTYRKIHLNRLEDLEKNFVIIGKCKLDFELYLSIFDPSYDNELCNELINSDIGKLFSFNRKTYKKVIKIMKKLFSNTKAKNIIRKLNKLPDEQKKIFLYYEFFTCYKHAVNMPELLTISGLFKEKKNYFITFVLHIINLISNSVDNIKNKKIFIKIMISIVFKIFYRDKFDIFEIQNYNVKCNEKLHNLYFFTWEFCFNKQKRIKNRKSVNSSIFKRDSSLVKAVLLMFLYQHMFYMKFLNITDQDSIRFQDFILIIIESDDCAGCLLNEIFKTTSDS